MSGGSEKRFLAAFLLLLSSLLQAAPTHVSVSGRKLLVNDQPFTVQGVAYSPIPIGFSIGGSVGDCTGPFYWWGHHPVFSADFPLIKAMGANTIRTFGILNDLSASNVLQVRAALDAAHAQGLYVMMNYFPDHHADSSSVAQQTAWQTGFVAAVNAYKDHPAVLLWEFGNENNLDNGQYAGWYPFVDQVAAAAKAADPDHPVMTVEGETGPIPFSVGSFARSADDTHMVHLDLWGVNAYRGVTFQGLFDALAASTSKPVVVTEFGKDAYRDARAAEDQAMQAAYVNAQWQEIATNLSAQRSGKILAGAVAFEWTDEWWKLGACSAHDLGVLFSRSGDLVDPNYQEEWFGLTAVTPIDAITNPAGTQRTLRQSYGVLQSFWNPASAGPAGTETGSFFSETVRNYPNPFRLGGGSTKFVILTTEAGEVDLRIYDAGGQFVTSMSRTATGPGRIEALWDGHNGQGEQVSSGLYFVRIHGKGAAHEDTQFRRIVAVK